MKDREEYISILEQDNAELKKQLEEANKTYFKLSKENNEYAVKLHKYKTQQQYFINYLTAYIELLNNEPDLIEESQIDILKEILQKYKEIIGGKEC